LYSGIATFEQCDAQFSGGVCGTFPFLPGDSEFVAAWSSTASAATVTEITTRGFQWQ
jgi:hypothetical protein